MDRAHKPISWPIRMAPPSSAKTATYTARSATFAQSFVYEVNAAKSVAIQRTEARQLLVAIPVELGVAKMLGADQC
eukprot:gene3904-biopygen2745